VGGVVSAAVEYADFLAAKSQANVGHGFESTLPAHLFDFQRDLTEWAIRQGRAAIFADCGMGKTPMELAWADAVHRHTGKPVLLLTPLAVGFQIVTEAAKFGHEAAMSRTGKPSAAITVTNYEQAEKFNPRDFGGIVCDESSAIKAFDGTTRAVVTELMREMPYRLLGTATAAPNDYLELGTSSEALGELGYTDMLSRFFVNDNRTVTSRSNFAATGRAVGWRFKGHAEQPFWRWVASWARAIRRPSDYGYDDGAFVLPALVERVHVVEAMTAREGTLFDVPAVGLAEEREEKPGAPWMSAANARPPTHRRGGRGRLVPPKRRVTRLAKLIPGAVEVTGSDSPDEKESQAIRVLPRRDSRPRDQASHRRMGSELAARPPHDVLPSHSYEQYYQAVRRMWRFGQQQEVLVDVVTTKGGENTLRNLQRKAAAADAMFDALIAHMNDALHMSSANTTTTTKLRSPNGSRREATGHHRPVRDLQRRLHRSHADLPDNSFHGSIYSPPFAGLYHYSSDERDLSNARTRAEFFEHYGYVIREKLRLTIPGRTSAVHAAPIPSGNTGSDSLFDFPGAVIAAHEAAGWLWVSRHAIWKEPLAVRNRTMQKNLAHKTIVEDGARVMSPRRRTTDLPQARRRRAGSSPNGLHGEYAGGEQPPPSSPLPRLGGRPEGQPVLALDLATLRLVGVGRHSPRPTCCPSVTPRTRTTRSTSTPCNST
jgi:hypothetical protein